MRQVLSYLMLAPRNLFVGILKIYRAVVSPLYGDVCRYYPSCSLYAMQAIQHHGVIRGLWFGTKRLARCHPWAEGGIDDIPERVHEHVVITRFGFAVPGRSIASAEIFASSHRKG